MVDGKFDFLMNYWDEKSGRELGRENFDARKQIHTDLLWREVQRVIGTRSHLKILDAGAGPGRFSIPLAQKGHEVDHLDISSKMIAIAQAKTETMKLFNIHFSQASLCNPLKFPDRHFDITLCLDSPLSYCYKNYEQTLTELIRVTKSSIILNVSNKLGVILEDGGNFDLEHYGKLKTIKELYQTGTLLVNDELLSFQPSLMPSWHAFTPAEIVRLFNDHGWEIDHISAPGTFVRFTDETLFRALLTKKEAYHDFLEFAAKFDAEPSIVGVGAINAGGLLITAKPKTK